ncbi:hypothetical protein GE09DRAFT_1183047 [Coniochaeta sp. 2T2.1]|nr:hypothetical protein GE09DRAFT_1183047 [Coniochaeta sp. 2T2.1]
MAKKKNNKTAAGPVAKQGADMSPSAARSSTPGNQSPPTITTGHVDNPANNHHQQRTSSLPELFSTLTISTPNKNKAHDNTTQNHPESKPHFDVVAEWDAYFGEGTTSDWARFCVDLGLEGDFTSKTKCKKAMKNVWINIHDFLEAEDKQDVPRFTDERTLSIYTRCSGKVYRRKEIRGDSPLKLLLANILYPRGWMGRKKKAKKVVGTELVKA